MNEIKYNKITKSEFVKLNEDDLIFITNPGRMGDEDGSTFIIKHENEFTIYRIDGWMYPNYNEKKEFIISMDDATKQFPKWFNTWKHSKEKNYKGKYKYIYMGFGNGLSVDNSIYDEFEPFLDQLVQKEFEKYDDKESMKYATIYNLWQKALINMINDKGYIIK